MSRPRACRAVCTSVGDQSEYVRHPERAQRRGISGKSDASPLPEIPQVGKPPIGMTGPFHPSWVCGTPHVKTRDDVWCRSSPTQLQPALDKSLFYFGSGSANSDSSSFASGRFDGGSFGASGFGASAGGVGTAGMVAVGAGVVGAVAAGAIGAGAVAAGAVAAGAVVAGFVVAGAGVTGAVTLGAETLGAVATGVAGVDPPAPDSSPRSQSTIISISRSSR